MQTNYKINIPKPCDEDWNQMTPEETGRFCNNCVKSVVDFTTMNAPEIQEYFIKNQGKKICGRFNNNQLNKFDIQIPESFLKKRMPFHRAFLLALFISMGSTLFSCKNQNGATLGEVAVVKDSVKEQEEIMGKIDISKKDSLIKAGVKLPPLPPVKQVKFVKPSAPGKTTGEVAYTTTGIVAVNVPQPQRVAPAENEILNAAAVDVKPDFPGGLTKFFQYVKSNSTISEENKKISGTLFVNFVVNTDGSLSDIKLLRGVNKDIDAEVLRVLQSSPKWIPGEYNSQKVRVLYSIPIKITAKE